MGLGIKVPVLCFAVLIFPLVGPGFARDKKGQSAGSDVKVLEDGSVEKDGRITRFWQVNYQNPPDVQHEVEDFLGKSKQSGIDIRPQGKNILRIEAPAEEWPMLKRLLNVVDLPEPQVLVEAKIIEIQYNSDLEFGFEATWDRTKSQGPQTFFGTFTGTFDPQTYLEDQGTGKTFQGGTIQLQNSDHSIAKNGEISYILRALQTRGRAELLSQPSILALQGESAEVNTGVQFPVQSVQVQANQSYVTTTFQKTGIILRMTPLLVGREYVKLRIQAQDSQVTDEIPGPNGSVNPVISSRTATTMVSVRDGETIIIGGLLSSSTIKSKTGLPLLSDIPLLSYLFSSTQNQQVKSELVFFITPHIVKRKEQTIILPPTERMRLKRP